MTDSPSPAARGGFNGWWLGSAAFVLVVLVAAVLVIITGRTPAEPGASPSVSATGPGSPAGTPGTADPDGACAALGEGDAKVPTQQAPTGLHWEIVNTVAVPWSTTAGPLVRQGPIRRCYLHSPTGALLAATNLAVTTESPGSDQVLATQVVPGPTRDARLQAARTQPPLAKQPGQTATFAGYRFVTYDPASAVIELAFAFGGNYAMATYYVQWDSGDWKLNLDPPGGAVAGHSITSLAGYVPWGAV